MKKMKLIILVLILVIPIKVYAQRGCCSRNGGVCGCNKYGRQVCCNGDLSPTCTCTPPTVYGCTDYKANNYNADANKDDGTCTYTVRGCTDSNANNYNPEANENDGSCKYDVYGCTDYKAKNYNSNANKDDGSCEYNPEENSSKGSSINDYIHSTENKEENESSPLGGLGVLGLTSAVGEYAYHLIKKKK